MAEKNHKPEKNNKLKKNNKTKDVIIFSTIIIIFLGILAYSFISKDNGISAETVAKCLSEKNATFYGSKYCTHCQEQKKMFGEYMNIINQVECTIDIEKCQKDGITAYPTWIIEGRTYVGSRDLKTLSDLSCN